MHDCSVTWISSTSFFFLRSCFDFPRIPTLKHSLFFIRSMSPNSRQRILNVMGTFRPAFRDVAQSLTDIDLILVEEAFERLLLVGHTYILPYPLSAGAADLLTLFCSRITTEYSALWQCLRVCGDGRVKYTKATRSLLR